MTFCLGPDGNNAVFNARLTTASAALAYRPLTTPVFGSGVVYDCDNALLMQQKKMEALTTAAFVKYVPMIQKETEGLIREWNIFEPKLVDLFTEMAELTIRTASACLLGKEIRAALDKNVSALYHDLDGGLAPINMFIPWLPIPSYLKRDAARKNMTKVFTDIIEKRKRENDMINTDVLQTFMSNEYKDGGMMNDEEVAHMMIALLMVLIHASNLIVRLDSIHLQRQLLGFSSVLLKTLNTLSATPHNNKLVEDIRKELSLHLTQSTNTEWKDLPATSYDDLAHLHILNATFKETLRLHPPIHTVMRVVTEDIPFADYIIPKGDYICAAPCISQLCDVKYSDPLAFDPSRFLESTEDLGEWTMKDVDAQKGTRSNYVPFGAGRHRCIGEAFAGVQIKGIALRIMREFSLALGPKGFPEKDYTTLIVMPVKNSTLVMTRR